MRVVSTNKINKELNLDLETSKKVHEIAAGKIEPDTVLDDPPSKGLDTPTRKLMAINKLVGGYGVESIGNSKVIHSYYKDIRYLYVNVGETYKPTIIYDVIDQRFYADSIGNILEKGRGLVDLSRE